MAVTSLEQLITLDDWHVVCVVIATRRLALLVASISDYQPLDRRKQLLATLGDKSVKRVSLSVSPCTLHMNRL